MASKHPLRGAEVRPSSTLSPAVGPAPSPDAVREALRAVIDPELGDNVVDLGMVTSVTVDPDGAVRVDVALTIAGCPLRSQLERDVTGRLAGMPGVRSVEVRMGEMDAAARAAVMERARWKARESAPDTSVSPTTRVLAIASGKGGVGKSSVSVNLAVAMARQGLVVGVLDADIWGFSVPRLLGMEGDVEARHGKMVPLTCRVGDGELRVLSMGFLADEDRAIMWRGLVLNRAVQQFLQDAHWGDLDYLLIDLPPGTGDVQMGLAPPAAPHRDADRDHPSPGCSAGRRPRRRHGAPGYLRVAGVIENMSDFTCEHGTTYALFGHGGGARLAAELGVPLVGSIPLHPDLSTGGDLGEPVALGDGELAGVFAALARRLTEEVAPLIEASGCTARLLDRVSQAVAEA